MNEQLQKKIDQSIKLLQSACGDDVVEIAYSGGKDSDVILQLAKEAGIKYRAIYKNTTIDPPGTLKHVREMGVEVLQPKRSFFKIVEAKGYPSRFVRFCCSELKEYKVLDKCIMGVRKSESKARNERYIEPTQCRFYGSKKEYVEAIYPILEWTKEDVRDYLQDRGVKCAPLYYDEQGKFHEERRLGCMCCPLAGRALRVAEFKKHPQMVKAYLRSGQRYRDTHPHSKSVQAFPDVYEFFYFCLFEDRIDIHMQKRNGLFGKPDYKSLLEETFGIDLTI